MLTTVTKLTPKAIADFKALQGRRPTAALTELPSGAALVTLDFELPSGWSAAKIVLRFVMPNGYPVTPPDGFWAEPNLTVNGRVPRSVEASRQIPETNISNQRFSWHIDNGHWSANRDDLFTWLRSCHERLTKLE
jgi:Prokaryotic E2 family E